MSATTKEVSEKQKKLETLIDSDKGKELLAKVATARKTYVDARAKLLERKKAGEDVFALVDSDLRPMAQNYIQSCWRRFKIEPPCRLNFEPGLMANL